MHQPNVKGWENIQGVSIFVSGNVDEAFALTFAGRYGGSASPYYDHNCWRFGHKMLEGVEGTPEIIIDFMTPALRSSEAG